MLIKQEQPLTTNKEIDAYLHRTRMEILRILQGAPGTVSGVAKTLGVHPANLSRHFRILAEANLIALVETRDTGKNLEKYYSPTAREFTIRSSDSAIQDPARKALRFAISDIEAAMADLSESDQDLVLARIESARIPRERFGEFCEALERLASSFRALDESGGDPLRLSLCLYPSRTGSGPDARIIIEKER